MSLIVELPSHLQTQAETLAAEWGASVEHVVLDLLAEGLTIHTAGLPTLAERGARLEEHLRAYSATQGVAWDELSDAEQEALISQLVHEARGGTSRSV